jgi:hypothetical protein
MTYDISDKLEIGFLGNYARNKYTFIPKELEQAFGTDQNVLQLRIFYEGSELDNFTTSLGALTFDFHPDKHTTIQWINSAFNTNEEETFDILGQYLINEVDESINSQASDSVLNIGIGTFLDHARNFLVANVLSSEIKGTCKKNNNRFKWGIKYQQEIIDDKVQEWGLFDSAGYSLPYSDTAVFLDKSVISENYLNTYRIHSYFYNSHQFFYYGRELILNSGIRLSYWSFNQELLISPRATISYKPLWNKDYLFRLSGGIYYQPPFYREMRFPDGTINTNIKAQRSIHFVLGADHNFTAWNRPFKFITELYYKNMDKLIPYKIDNVRVRYNALNNAHGYATGLDMKINGEFVKGVESWFSASFMTTREDIEGDSYVDNNGNTQYPGYYPRPTDQLLNFGLFFQDYFPNNPTWTMQLTLMYGSQLPYSPPHSDRYDLFFRMPSYKRVDVGISKIITDKKFDPDNPEAYKGIKKCWVGLEIFNLFNNSNTISYLWVRTISGSEQLPDMFAVPQYLTARRFNLKMALNF